MASMLSHPSGDLRVILQFFFISRLPLQWKPETAMLGMGPAHKLTHSTYHVHYPWAAITWKTCPHVCLQSHC